jgi:3-methyladenine DNA glycosylase AlkC
MLLKEVYSEDFLFLLAKTIKNFDNKFADKELLKLLNNWGQKDLKQRMRAISLKLFTTLSADTYQEKIATLKQVVVALAKEKNSSLAFIVFPDFVENFGLDDFDFSMSALEFFTEFGSSEFAVRQFIKSDQKRALNLIKKWTKSKNVHIRRLASEGIRPMLPWGEALIEFKKDPASIIKILEELKFDREIYVQKSIANNLNDISKNHPEVVLDLMAKWSKQEVAPSLIKHALRTLLKKGNKQALSLIGVKHSENYSIQSFALQKNVVKMLGDLVFDFALENKEPGAKIRLEYALYFLKQNQSHFKKIFQITTKNFALGKFSFSKKHSFREITTRKYNAGLHMISLVVNGIEIKKLQFELK